MQGRVREVVSQMVTTTSQIVQAVILKVLTPPSWVFHTAWTITRQDYEAGLLAHPTAFPPATPSITIYAELYDSALPKGGCCHFLIQDQSKERKEWTKPRGDQIFSFQPPHALTSGFPPLNLRWEGGKEEGWSLGSQQAQQQATVLKMLVESGLS